MTSDRHEQLWRPARDIPLLVLCATTVLSFIRAVDQPGFALGVGGTDVRLVPADLALGALAALVGARLLGRGALPRPARAVAYAAAAFAAWLLASSAANGGEAVVGAGKLLEFGILALGTALFVQRRAQLWLLVAVVVAVTLAASVLGLLAFFDLPPLAGDFPGKRQPSFLGEHDLSTLGAMSLSVALGCLFAGGSSHPRHRLTALAGSSGTVAVTLGASLAGLISLYLAAGAIVAVAALHGRLSRRRLAVAGLVLAVATSGVLTLRSGDLTAFLRYLGIAERTAVQDENAASWSQRLIYVYIGGRVFIDNPVLGTGWHGELPPEEFARYLPDAHARFPDQPLRYFPSPGASFIPQQAYDQVLFELGVVGAALFLVLGALTLRSALSVARGWPRGDPDEPLAVIPLAWTLILIAALAGAALFGGIPLNAIFWLTLGVAALAPSLMPARPRER